jgi:hypothetical protein
MPSCLRLTHTHTHPSGCPPRTWRTHRRQQTTPAETRRHQRQPPPGEQGVPTAAGSATARHRPQGGTRFAAQGPPSLGTARGREAPQQPHPPSHCASHTTGARRGWDSICTGTNCPNRWGRPRCRRSTAVGTPPGDPCRGPTTDQDQTPQHSVCAAQHSTAQLAEHQAWRGIKARRQVAVGAKHVRQGRQQHRSFACCPCPQCGASSTQEGTAGMAPERQQQRATHSSVAWRRATAAAAAPCLCGQRQHSTAPAGPTQRLNVAVGPQAPLLLVAAWPRLQQGGGHGHASRPTLPQPLAAGAHAGMVAKAHTDTHTSFLHTLHRLEHPAGAATTEGDGPRRRERGRGAVQARRCVLLRVAAPMPPRHHKTMVRCRYVA